MSYGELRVKVGRRPITVVEFDLDTCANVFGVAPCTASGSGDAKCYNTFKTCQDTPNFNKTVKTHKFCSNIGGLPLGENMHPCIVDVDIASTQLLMDGLAVSTSVSITMTDFTHHDRGVDPYVSERSYNPSSQGTFFGKLRARNPHMYGRTMRVKTGYIDPDDRTVYTRTRTYFIEKMEGPDANGRVKFTGKGLMRFGDDENITVPRTTSAYLQSGINNSTNTLSLRPVGVGDAEFPSANFNIRVEDELMFVSSRSGDTCTMSERGSEDSAADAHVAGKAVQFVYREPSGVDEPHEVLKYILTEHLGIDPSYINDSEWAAEGDLLDVSGFVVAASTIIPERTPAKDVIQNLLQTFGCILWYDEVGASLRFKVLRSDESAIGTVDEDNHILANSLSVRDLEKERISRISTSFGRTTYMNPPSRETNLRMVTTVDADGESAEEYGEAKSQLVLSYWNVSITVDFVAAYQTTMLPISKETPREFKFNLDAKDSDYKEGDVVNILTRQTQAPDGSKQAVKCIITECREIEPGSHFQYKARQIAPVT